MTKNLLDFIKYKNTCRDCGFVFNSEGWMRPFCKECRQKYQKAFKEAAIQKGLTSYRVHKKVIEEKHPQIGYGHCGTYNGIFCQSTWELAVAIWACEENLTIRRSPHIIYYMFEEKQHRYHPDFEIDGKTYEIKGRVTPKEIAKQQYAKKSGIEIIFIDPPACEFYFEYVYSKHGKDPRVDWEYFYDKIIKEEQVLEPIKLKNGSGKYPLAELIREPDAIKQRERLLEYSILFRDKGIMAIYIRSMENEHKPVKEHIQNLHKAAAILYPDSV